MSVLQEEIKRFSQQSARRLEQAGLHSDSEILSLTREDLRDLIPGAKNFQLRRRVYEIIHRQKPIGVQNEMQQLIQHESLREAGLHSDSEILSLTQEDLHDLFPGAENFKLRRRVYEIILRQKPIGVLKEMQQLIQHESLRAALTNNGVLVECLPILKDLKTQVKNYQSLLESRLSLPESISNNQQDLEPNKGYNAGSLPSTSATSNPGECPKNQTDDHPPEAKVSAIMSFYDSFPGTKGYLESLFSPWTGDRPQKSQSTVTYEMVVCGKTFDAHLQLMNSVKSPVQDWLQFIESSKDSRVVVVFCPISSHIGSDVEAAMRDVKVEKPVILVLMHHRRDAGSTNFGRTWDTPNVVLCVSVFYHETINGLVKCDENDVAISEIRRKLMEYKTEVKIPMEMDGSSSRFWW